MGVRRSSLGRGDIARDANWLRPFLPAVGGDTYRVRVSVVGTTPDYLDAKITSTDGSPKNSDDNIGEALTKSPADTTAWCGVRAFSDAIALAM